MKGSQDYSSINLLKAFHVGSQLQVLCRTQFYKLESCAQRHTASYRYICRQPPCRVVKVCPRTLGCTRALTHLLNKCVKFACSAWHHTEFYRVTEVKTNRLCPQDSNHLVHVLKSPSSEIEVRELIRYVIIQLTVISSSVYQKRFHVTSLER